MKPIHEINNNLIQILLKYKTIGIFASGGFDSTLLAYLVHDLRNKLHYTNVFKFFTVPRYNLMVHSGRIIKFIDDKFNTTPSIHHQVGNPNLHHSVLVGSGMDDALDNYDVDVIMTGVTRNPPGLDAIEGAPVRPVIRLLYQANHPRIFIPFGSVTKADLVQIAIDMNLTEIMTLSHTCCAPNSFLRCDTCWFCLERAWAFKQCNYVDPGQM